MTATTTAFAGVPNVQEPDVRKLTKAQLKREVEPMSRAMVEQKGLPPPFGQEMTHPHGRDIRARKKGLGL